jgi:prevent-host-death family protein
MVTVGAFAAKTHLAALLERVERGEEVLVTRHGKAVARLVPVATADRAETAATIARLKELRAGTTLGGLSWEALRDEGRR